MWTELSENDFFYEEDKIVDLTTTTTSTETTTETPINLEETFPSTTSFSNDFLVSRTTSPSRIGLDAIESEMVTNTNTSTSIASSQLLPDDVNSTWLHDNSFRIHKPFYNHSKQRKELQRLGMEVTTKCVALQKDETNLLGISIGGGAPLCPCLYIVQIFDGTPAAMDGNLESGDELLAINNVAVKGKTKVQVAKMIQAATDKVILHFNKLHADPERGKSLDIILKKLKHRLVDNMSSNTADNLGLSRAILCNDSLVKRLEELDGTEIMYKGLVEHAERVLKAYYAILQSYREFGDCFLEISTRESQQRASEAFRLFGEFHRNLEKDGLQILEQMKPIIDELATYLVKAIPDTKLTINRYMDAKFTYLSYCLKIKEMDDEEQNFATLQETLYRVETGNYEYRLILRCRQDARLKFAKLRTDVLEKMELLECKHSNDLTTQLATLLEALKELNQSILIRLGDLPHLFPIEMDFKETDFQYKSNTLEPQNLDEDEEARYYSGEHISTAIEAVAEEEQPAPIITVLRSSDNSSLSNAMALLQLDNDDVSHPRENTGNTLLLSSSSTITSLMPGGGDFELFLNQNPSSPAPLPGGGGSLDAMASNSHETDLILQ